MQAAIDAGADYLGFVFHAPSPRHLDTGTAAELVGHVPAHVKTVALFVDPDDKTLESVLNRMRVDLVQLHGDETPQRAAEIKSKFRSKIIKAIRIGSKTDAAVSAAYKGIADFILFDAKSPDSAVRGGTGQRFDWGHLKGFDPSMNWFLAGGLTPENVGEALSVLSPDVVDVSSGVETAPGQKDAYKIQKFIKAVHDSR